MSIQPGTILGSRQDTASIGQRGQERLAALMTLIRQGWGTDAPTFRQLFTSMFLPTANAEQTHYFNEMQRASASPQTAARCLASFGDIDVRELAKTIQTPTLVVHRRDDVLVSFKRGRAQAAMIPGARFVPMEGENHWLLLDEPGAATYVEVVERFVGSVPAS